MGVPGLWDLLKPAGKPRSLIHLAVLDGYEKNKDGKRGYRIGIDASIWFFHASYGKEGENPELRTLFFRLCRLAEAPFLPLLVFDGPHRPDFKRGKRINRQKQHWLEPGVKRMINAFGWEWWQVRTPKELFYQLSHFETKAPGEAEAELAYLNRIGVIDAVLSDDVDNFVFGTEVLIRNPSNNLTGNRSNPTLNADGRDDGKHTVIYCIKDIEEHEEVGLSRNGMLLIALLAGGDYNPDGVEGCGKLIARGLARCGFGDSLVHAFLTLPAADFETFVQTWRMELIAELRTNSRRIIGRKNVALASKIPHTFPNINIIKAYVQPVTSESRGLKIDASRWWSRDMDLAEVAGCCEQFFEWGVKDIILKRFRTVLWPGACLRILRQAALEQDRRAARDPHFADPATPRKSKRPPKHLAVGTPSKLITRYFSKLGLDCPQKDDDDAEEDKNPLMVTIHSSRQHASTDHILEYRVEIAPLQLASLAAAGVKGTRRVEDLQRERFSDLEEQEEEEEEEEKKTKGKGKGTPKLPPEPETIMRVWLPACMMEYVQLELVEKWEEKERVKAAKKAGKGKGKKKAAAPVSGEDEETPKKPKPKSKGKAKAKVPAGSDDEEGVVPPKRSKAKPKVKSRTPTKAKKPSKIWESSEEEEEEEDLPLPVLKSSQPMSEVEDRHADDDLPTRLKKPSPAPIRTETLSSQSHSKFAFSQPSPDEDSDVEEPLPPPRAQSAPKPSVSKLASMLDAVDAARKAKQPKQPRPVKPPKSKATKKVESAAVSAAAAFFDSLSCSDGVVSDDDPLIQEAIAMSCRPMSNARATSSSSTIVSKTSESTSTTAVESDEPPLPPPRVKKSRGVSQVSSPSVSDEDSKKSPRKNREQTSPRKTPPKLLGSSRSPSPSPIRPRQPLPKTLKAIGRADYIEISSSEEEMEIVPQLIVQRPLSKGGKRPPSKEPKLGNFGFPVTKGLEARASSKPLKPKVQPRTFGAGQEFIDLT